MLKCYLSFQLKFFQGSLSHFVHVRLTYTRRHCERKRSNPGKRSRNRVRDDRFLHILPATCHRGRRKPVRDLWIASSQNIGLDYSGCRRSNVRFQLTGWGTSCHGALPKIRPRNDVKCAALSLAALKDFVCKANETYVHLVEAMPQAAQKSFACFFFCLLLQLRALLETCKMASLFHSVVNGSLFLLGCSRITSSRALPFGNALHSTLTIRFFPRNKKEKVNNEYITYVCVR